MQASVLQFLLVIKARGSVLNWKLFLVENLGKGNDYRGFFFEKSLWNLIQGQKYIYFKLEGNTVGKRSKCIAVL